MNLLSDRKFDQLESIAADLRSTKRRFPGGPWRLQKFYTGLSMPDGGLGAAESHWREHLAELKQWMRQKPDSVAAHIALAGSLVDYGWKARGSGFADTVTDEGWRLLRQRLEEAGTVLASVGEKRRIDPHWYWVMQCVAMGQGWDRQAYDKVFDEGAAVEPLYHYLYIQKAEYLMPRWHGEPGDWQTFADEAAVRVGGQRGSALYYLIVSSVHHFYRTNLYTEADISWPRVKQGYFDLVDLYGVDLHNMNAIIVLAGMAGDRALALDMFRKLGDRWDPESWREKRLFDEWLQWAQGTR